MASKCAYIIPLYFQYNGNQGLILGQTDTPRVGLNYW